MFINSPGNPVSFNSHSSPSPLNKGNHLRIRLFWMFHKWNHTKRGLLGWLRSRTPMWQPHAYFCKDTHSLAQLWQRASITGRCQIIHMLLLEPRPLAQIPRHSLKKSWRLSKIINPVAIEPTSAVVQVNSGRNPSNTFHELGNVWKYCFFNWFTDC